MSLIYKLLFDNDLKMTISHVLAQSFGSLFDTKN